VKRTALLALLLPATAFAWTPMSGDYPVWGNDTITWRMDNSGAQTLTPVSTIEAIFIDSYDEWVENSCTGFQHNYLGQTSGQPGNTSNGQTFHSFAQQWAFQWGDVNSTLGVTFGVWNTWPSVEFSEADVIYNEAAFTWVDGAPSAWGNEADLQSVATHEFGHSLGLGHSNAQDATMWPSVLPGTQSRTLATDDINGVCSLYPGNNNPGDDDDAVGDDDDATPPPTGDDSYEDNDTASTAATVSCGDTINGTAIDLDYFSVTTSSTGTVSASLSWGDPGADLDLYLIDPSGQQAIDWSEATSGTSESVSENNLSADTYIVAVSPWSGSDDYSLTITCNGAPGDDDDAVGDDDDTPPTGDDAFEPNNDPSQSVPAACGDSIQGIANDQDWFALQTSSSGDIDITLSWTSTAADLDLYITDQSVNILDGAESETGTFEQVGLTNAAAGVYGILVNPWEGSDAYTLNISCDGVVGDDDDATPPPGDDDDDDAVGDDDDAADDDDNGGDDDDNSDDDDDDDTGSGRGSRGRGCACDAIDGSGSGAGLAIVLLGLLGFVRRK
jgi:MYXO-CTERM domain-containing protein